MRFGNNEKNIHTLGIKSDLKTNKLTFGQIDPIWEHKQTHCLGNRSDVGTKNNMLFRRLRVLLGVQAQVSQMQTSR